MAATTRPGFAPGDSGPQAVHQPARAPRALTRESVGIGARELARRDPDLARLLDRHGPPPLWARRPGFSTLVRIILEQQVSLAAARTMYGRLSASVGLVTPATVAELGVDGLRRLGFTGQKSRYCHGLAERVRAGQLDLRLVARVPDHEGEALLLAVPGLGPWSVAVYFLMALRRPDIWPSGDLALAKGLQVVKRMRRLPDQARQARIAARWAPWRSVAARLIWQDYLAERASPSS